jgi:hypothetical protein
MGSGTINTPTGYTVVSLTSVTASNGDPWSGSGVSSTISFTASQSDDEISNGQTVTVVFSATNPSSADSYTWTTAAYSDTSEGGTAFTIGGSQPSVTVNAGVATRLVVTSSSGVQTAGVPFTILVRAEDAYGNTATSYLGTVVFTTSDLGFGVSLPSTYTFTAEDAGAASFSAVLVTAGSQSITATDTVTSSITGSLAVMVTHASVALSVTVLPGTATITAGGSQAFTATDKDVYGNTWDVTCTVDWSIDSGAGGSVSACGLATATKVGTWTVSALDGSGNIGVASLTVDQGVATHFVVSGFQSPTAAGVSGTVTVTAYDSCGNVATGYTGTVQFASSDVQAVLPAGSTLSSGTGTFSVTLKTAGTQSIYATDSVDSSITGSQTGITVEPGSAVQFVFAAIPTETAGSFSVTITAEDMYGNTATSYVGTPSLSDISGTISPTVTSAFVGGVWSGTVTITLAGHDSITASDEAITGTSNTFTVTHASAVSIAVSPATDSITAGNSETYSAMATDAYGNSWDVTASVTWSIDPGANGG